MHIEVDDKITLYLKVKSSSENKCRFDLSGDEYNFAKDHTENYMVIFVADMDSANPKITPLEMKFWEDEKFSVCPNNFTVTYIFNDKN